MAEGNDDSYKKLAWKDALDHVGVPFAVKGTPAYERVMKEYLETFLPARLPPLQKLWQDCCKHVTGHAFVSSQDAMYLQVKDLYTWAKLQAGNMKEIDLNRFVGRVPEAQRTMLSAGPRPVRRKLTLDSSKD